MHLTATALWLVAVVGLVDPPAPPGPGLSEVPFKHADVVRPYLIHVPTQVKPDVATPVVLALHGFGMTARSMVRFSGWNEVADREGFVVVYPSGVGVIPRWNAGCMGPGADDVGYIRAVIDDVASRLRIDPRRVYATGMSNGGMMSYRLAAELADRIAAIGAVGGTMTLEPDAPAGLPPRGVAVLHIHGTDDPIVPYGGPDARTPRFIDFASVDRTVEAWRKINKCEAEPRWSQLPDRRPEDGTRAEQTVYGEGREGSEVVLVRVIGGGHTWPGKPTPLARLGRTCLDFSASEIIWEFFHKHAMP